MIETKIFHCHTEKNLKPFTKRVEVTTEIILLEATATSAAIEEANEILLGISTTEALANIQNLPYKHQKLRQKRRYHK